jgi:hypothetical protein
MLSPTRSHFTNYLKKATPKSAEASDIQGPNSLPRWHSSVTTQSLYATSYAEPLTVTMASPVLTVVRLDSSPSPPSPGRRNLNTSITRMVVVTWKHIMHTIRRESRHGVPTGFTLIAPGSQEKPWSLSESGDTSLATKFTDTSSEWSLV